MDLAGSSLGLLLAAPIMLAVAVRVAATLGRPILYRAQRAGREGEPFTLYKFRTMTEEQGPDGSLLPDEARITRLGRVLRATTIDELPELWNVLRGDMSLVGPRPLHQHYVERYGAKQRRRLEVKPGLTGWAVVHGRNALTWEERFDLDVWYVEHRTFWLDVRILAKTFVLVLGRRGVQAEGHATMPEFRGSKR